MKEIKHLMRTVGSLLGFDLGIGRKRGDARL